MLLSTPPLVKTTICLEGIQESDGLSGPDGVSLIFQSFADKKTALQKVYFVIISIRKSQSLFKGIGLKKLIVVNEIQ